LIKLLFAHAAFFSQTKPMKEFDMSNRSIACAVVLVFAFYIPAFSQEAVTPPEYAPVEARLFTPGDGLGNIRAKLDAGEEVEVAYLGGSITAANGWRVKTTAWLRETYPQATINEVHAAIGGTGSDLGVFRFERDVLRHGCDLLFVEFAVNDGGASPERIWQAMEGIVRQAWAPNPRTDVCFVYTYRVGYEDDLRDGNYWRAAGAMEMLARHYGITTINIAMPVVEAEAEGRLVFKSDEPTEEGVVRFSSDGVHPLDVGHEMYTETIALCWGLLKPNAAGVDHGEKLGRPFVTDHWQAAGMTPLTESMLSGEWRSLPGDDTLQNRFGNRMGQIWESGEPGATLTFRFKGSAAKLYDLLGPDGGQVIITVDGVTREQPVARFDSYCTYHRLATLTIAEGLDPDVVHEVVVEIHPEQPDRSPVAFRLQDPDVELQAPKFQGTKLRVGQILLLGELVE
jgi:hypothetical protein